MCNNPFYLDYFDCKSYYLYCQTLIYWGFHCYILSAVTVSNNLSNCVRSLCTTGETSLPLLKLVIFTDLALKYWIAYTGLEFVRDDSIQICAHHLIRLMEILKSLYRWDVKIRFYNISHPLTVRVWLISNESSNLFVWIVHTSQKVELK